MPSPKARPPLQCQQSPQSTPTTMVRPRIRPRPLQSQHSVQSPESPPTQRPRLRPQEEPPQQSPQPPKLAPPPLAAASEVHVVRREEPESPQLMALPVAAASEVDDVREEHPMPKPMLSRPKWSQHPRSMAKPVAAAPHHTNLTIAETQEHEDGVAPSRAEAAAARAEAAAARALAAVACALAAVAAATHANQSRQSPPPKMAPPPLAAASGKQNGPKGRGSVSTELPGDDVHEEKEIAEKEEQDPRHSQRSLRSPERPPLHLKRKRSTPSAPSDAPPDHLLLARAARTLQSSTTAQKHNDWTCPTCGNVNWFRRGYCIGGNNECLTPREPSWMPGDWFCECGNHNLRHRTVCNRTKCSLARAQGEKARQFLKQSG